MTGHYVNLLRGDRDASVYRILKLKYLYELFIQRQNVLARPESWDDPYENLRSRLEPPIRDRFCYGQCWTLHKASDAMWRIYSPMSNGSYERAVRVRSTIRELLDSLSCCFEPPGSAFVGRVRYLTTPNLIKYVKRASDTGARSVAETLLVKRPAFRHEREIRLLLLARSDNGKLLRYPVDPNKLVSQIMLDPRLDRSEAEALKQDIKAKTRFGGPILRSLLYAPPEF